ncbi:MAG: tyrosine-protein phosphatase [Clostridiaceae bacterium]|mgnify:CR=1 FL=1|nr:tyrosine-protein phosphatase [Clostridiaceae bacterium]
MIIEPDTNRLILPDIYNARDMGGMRTISGKTTAYRRFIRADSPSSLEASSIKALVDYPVRTVIDLRSESEVLRNGNPFIEEPGVLYANIPLFAADPANVSDDTMKMVVDNTLGDLYVYMLDYSQPSILSVFKTIVTSPTDGAVLFHCMHGKDRTGLIAALLYLLSGATKEDIIEDYSSSFQYIRPLVDPLIRANPESVHHMYRSDSTNMILLLEHFKRKYDDDIRGYLLTIGLHADEIEQLKSRLF